MTITFEEMGLDPAILRTLEELKFKEPSPIQAQAIPVIQKGRDVIGLAETGSGKTAACMIPICNRVDVKRRDIQALIIVPTRELCLQYATEAQRIGKRKGVKTFAMFGGEDQGLQMAKIKDGVQVLVATPGRLIDLIYQRVVDLSEVETLILDEADEMLSMGFYEDLDFIIQCLVHEHQTLLFSATMPKDIRRIAGQHMKDPLEVKLTGKRASPKTIEYKFLYCSPHDKENRLVDVINNEGPKQSIIFCQSRVQVEKLTKALKQKVQGVDYLHGGLGQNVRTIITDKFRSGRLKHLVATDVAARGLDFSGVTHVILYDLGRDVDTFVHRTGRTGRQDRKGVAIAMVTQRDMQVLDLLLKRIEREPIWIGKAPTPAQMKSKGGGGGPPRGRGGPGGGGSRGGSRSGSGRGGAPKGRSQGGGSRGRRA